MASRPRRSAAARAQENISVHAKWADSSERSDREVMSSRRSGRTSSAMVSRDPPSSPGDDSHLSVTVKVPATKLRQATQASSRRSSQFEGGEIVHGKRNRGAKKSYVVDSSPDDDEEEEEEEEDEEEADEDEEMEDEDAEGEEEEDAEGEDVDAEGDIDMDVSHRSSATTIKVSRSAVAKPKPAPRAVVSKPSRDDDDDDDDDDELSEPADSDLGDETMGYGDETMADEDAEGEEIEVAGDEDDEEEEEEEEEEGEGDTTVMGRGAAAASDEELDSDDEGSRAETPDLAKMTKRQRARFEDAPQEYMKLSDEIQVKKVFTAEELSMRRQEMARRRRNLSEKRNEEVKMETINKLLKKQAPKISRKAAAAEGEDGDSQKPNPLFIRWVSNKNGSQLAVPEEILEGPVGKVFGKPGLPSGKMVEEVA
ncbi:hypothetical protein PT974_10164 [Cladobotryum mycophilum]|uniref:INO80 complex subunit B-like conserved region domain-containing protein n=1 Tax=Cladobotryum mycophilum TaxID=491253 RepID=A0ABR0S981_9HYPO